MERTAKLARMARTAQTPLAQSSSDLLQFAINSAARPQAHPVPVVQRVNQARLAQPARPDKPLADRQAQLAHRAQPEVQDDLVLTDPQETQAESPKSLEPLAQLAHKVNLAHLDSPAQLAFPESHSQALVPQAQLATQVNQAPTDAQARTAKMEHQAEPAARALALTARHLARRQPLSWNSTRTPCQFRATLDPQARPDQLDPPQAPPVHPQLEPLAHRRLAPPRDPAASPSPSLSRSRAASQRKEVIKPMSKELRRNHQGKAENVDVNEVHCHFAENLLIGQNI